MKLRVFTALFLAVGLVILLALAVAANRPEDASQH